MSTIYCLLSIIVVKAILCFDIGEFNIGLFSSSYSSVLLQKQLSLVIDQSLQSHGIIKLTNSSLFSSNGTHKPITSALYNKSVHFFTQYSLSEKMKYCYGPPGTPGYLPQNSEGPSKENINLKESFVFYSVPNNTELIEPFQKPPILWNEMKRFWFAMNEIISHFHNAVKLALNISENNSSNVNNMFDHRHLYIAYYYETELENNNNIELELRHQPHTDGFGFTLLWTDNHCGLQIFNNDTNQWIDIAPDQNAMFVLSGQLIPYYTNNRWESVLHRVVKCKNDNDNDIIEARIVFVLFTGPELDAIIYPWFENEDTQTGLNVRQHLKNYWSNIDQLSGVDDKAEL